MHLKAVVNTRYGAPDVVQLRELERSTPRAGEVVIRVHAAEVTKGDGELRSWVG